MDKKSIGGHLEFFYLNSSQGLLLFPNKVISNYLKSKSHLIILNKLVLKDLKYRANIPSEYEQRIKEFNNGISKEESKGKTRSEWS